MDVLKVVWVEACGRRLGEEAWLSEALLVVGGSNRWLGMVIVGEGHGEEEWRLC